MASGDTPPTGLKKLASGKRLWLIIEIVNVRLRFIFLMALVGLIVGYWDNIMNHYDRWRRPTTAPEAVQACRCSSVNPSPHALAMAPNAPRVRRRASVRTFLGMTYRRRHSVLRLM